MTGPRILTTLDWHRRQRWMSAVDVLDRRALGTAQVLRRLVLLASDYDALVLDGATGGPVRLTDLGAAASLARLRSGPAVIITDATWKRGTSRLDRLACRAGLRAIDSPRVTYCVLSSEEQRRFPVVWGVAPERVAFTPFYFTASDHDLLAPAPWEGGVFAGGDSLRDYAPVVQAARAIRAPVFLATGTLPEELRAHLPENVRAGRVPHAEFIGRLRAASVVVVPLAETEDRAAGQQTYLNAMAVGKLVIVTDVMGVRDYVEDGRTGLIVPPRSPGRLAAALRWALDPGNRAAAREIAARAREVARSRFSPERYVDRVLEVVDEAVARAKRPPAYATP
jgi:glycosyltransferase involved in cell wall biosynthesis